MVYSTYLAVLPVRLSCRRTQSVLLSKDWFWKQPFDDNCRASDQVRKRLPLVNGLAQWMPCLAQCIVRKVRKSADPKPKACTMATCEQTGAWP